MRYSKLFTKTRKEVPADETSKNAQLLLKAGFISKEMAGVYSYMPLGLRVLNKIVEIIRQEMNAIGGQEIFMTTLQRPEVWEASDRWSDEAIDVWFKTKLANGKEVGLATTHEEPLTDMMRQYINSYKDLPAYPYQFQTKFRNELRSKSGLMRGREFMMKDLYSFSLDREQHEEFYEIAKQSYEKIFSRIGIGEDTFITFASGGSFSKFSHEFQTLTEAGEDTIYLSREKKIAVNKEVLNDEVLNDIGLKREELEEVKAAEVGNIFTLGTKFSDALDLMYTDKNGKKQPVFMGSYGIGPGRTMAVAVEKFADDKGMIWPGAIAPYQVHLIRIGNDSDTIAQADGLYDELIKSGVEVLYDDRNTRPGEMLADADLIGIPYRAIVSAKSIKADGVEFKLRSEEKINVLSKEAFLHRVKP